MTTHKINIKWLGWPSIAISLDRDEKREKKNI